MGEGKRGGSRGIEEEWRKFKETVLEVREDVCGTRKIRERKRRIGSEWWSEEIRRVVGRKKECFLIWRRTRNEEDLDEYRRMKIVVKRMVREAKKRVNEELTLSIAEIFKVNKKKIWKGVNEVRKGESQSPLSMRNSMGEELTRENDIEGRWKDYFVQLLKGDEMGEVGGDIRRERIVENERVVREVVREEIMSALKKMIGGKAAGMDAIVVEMLKNGDISIIP